jgi:hypothetical protein
MPKNPLVAVVRPDRNGKLVTRHVLAKNTGPDHGARIPPVALAPVREKLAVDHLEEEFRSMDDELKEDCPDEYDVDIEVLVERLRSRSTHVLNAYWKVMETRECNGLEYFLLSALNDDQSDKTLGYLLLSADKYVQIDSNWLEKYGGTQGYKDILHAYQGLLEHDHLLDLPDDILTAGEESQERYRALIHVVEDLECLQDDRYAILRDGKPTKILDGGLVRLVADRWQYVDAIRSVIEERETGDAHVIQAVLDAQVQALREGVL